MKQVTDDTSNNTTDKDIDINYSSTDLSALNTKKINFEARHKLEKYLEEKQFEYDLRDIFEDYDE